MSGIETVAEMTACAFAAGRVAKKMGRINAVDPQWEMYKAAWTAGFQSEPTPDPIDVADLIQAMVDVPHAGVHAHAARALALIWRYGGIDGAHHKTWVIDQVVRALLGEEEGYKAWVKRRCAGEDGPDTYEWETGIAP